jgi:hypothetical protein
MANFLAIHSVGKSLVRQLHNAYEPLREEQACNFRLVSSAELIGGLDDGETPALTLFLYRVTVNEHARNLRRAQEPREALAPLSLDLHFLLTVWAADALAEQSVLAWTMMQLHEHPVLNTSSLTPEAGWTEGDSVQLIPADLSTREIMRIWDVLDPAYRLSVSYIARVVRIDAEPVERIPVVATRFSFRERGETRG